MTTYTWADLKSRVEKELSMEDEDFVQDAEFLLYAKRAINAAESIILNLNADYFLSEPFNLTLVSGQQAYSLPSDIYAQKLRFIQYNNGSRYYQIKPLKDLSLIPVIQPTDQYTYVLTSTYANGTKLRLYPTPAEDGSFVSIWYLRNSNEVAALTDTIDLPEAIDYVAEYIKWCCINKERNTPDAAPSPNLEKQEALLIASLHQRTVDDPIVSTEDLQTLLYEVYP